MSLECLHGYLARKCEICERDERIAELERVLGGARVYFEMLKRATGIEHGNLTEIKAVLGAE